jgi:hypothetical protein
MLAAGCGGPEREIEQKLRDHVLFFSNFEKGVDALSAAGSILADIDGARTRHQLNGGIQDGCLTFEQDAQALSYAARGNIGYKPNQAWAGAVSFWLGVDPSKDLEADYPEPFHIGKRSGNAFPWDDAVIFVDFTKPPRSLRFGVYPDKTGEISDQMVAANLIAVSGLKWKSDEWHHVLITWRNFNSGKADAEWALFIDGKEKGRKKGIRVDLTWDIDSQVLRFNHYKYAGRMDEIAVFDAFLNEADARYLHAPKKPLNVLLKKDR